MSALMRDTRMPGFTADIPSHLYACGCGLVPGAAASAEIDIASAYLVHLYACEGLSTYQIADLTGIDRQRVTRALRRAGVRLRPRGAGRRRPIRRRDDPPDIEELVADLYEKARLSSRQIGVLLGMPERTVRDRLRRYGLRIRTRGGRSREERRTVPADVLGELYGRLGMSAAEVGRRLGTSRHVVLRSAHALGVPVRVGGAVLQRGPEEIELIDALYADPLVASALVQYEITRVPHGGPICERFPVPVPLTTPLVKDLYWQCGVGLNHIELLTGQPAMTVRGFMHRSGIPVRHPGGRTPFLRRWRAGTGGTADSSVTQTPRRAMKHQSDRRA